MGGGVIPFLCARRRQLCGPFSGGSKTNCMQEEPSRHFLPLTSPPQIRSHSGRSRSSCSLSTYVPSSGAALEAWSLFPSVSPPTPALYNLPGFYGNRLGRLCQEAKATTALEGRGEKKLKMKIRRQVLAIPRGMLGVRFPPGGVGYRNSNRMIEGFPLIPPIPSVPDI